MKALKNVDRKKLALMLAVVFLVSGSITVYAVFTSLVPDVVEQLAFERGEGDPTATNGNWQEYYDDWTVSAEDLKSISVDLAAVYVEFGVGHGDEISLQFSGQSCPNRSGDSPTIQLEQKGDTLNIRTNWQSDWTGTISNHLRGTLRIEIPNDIPMHLKADLLSGGVSLQDYEAKSVLFDSSSGDIHMENASARESVSLITMSGSITLANVTAQKDCVLDSSSGQVDADGLVAEKLTFDGFSGSVTLENLDIEGEVKLETSSGQIDVENFRAQAMRIDGFSGAVSLKSGKVTDALVVDVSDSHVTVENLTAKLCDVLTFAGQMDLHDLHVDSLKTDSSSGSLNASLLKFADISCVSFSGCIDLATPADYAFTVDIDSFSGDIQVDYPLMVQYSESSDHEIHGTVGAGTYTVVLETSSGDIHLLPLSAD